MPSRDLTDDLKLGVVGVLILIYHHVFELVSILGADRVVILQKPGSVEQDVVKIHCLIE